ncbi:NudC domain-containing protein 2 [Lamellibrachia satsuma]|nr:NudC domain-containing protein 2 [Lamellibrachia satsuma]
MDEVWIQVNLTECTRAKDIRCDVSTKRLNVCVKGHMTIQGELFREVHADDIVWTIEDKKLLVICLPKSDRTAGSCWKSLLDGQYEADPWTWDQMQQKLTLERYQIENPGMDFSGASISGSYQDGGPELPS